MPERFDIVKINETIVGMIDDYFLVCDLEGKIVFSNQRMQSYLGYTDSELKQKSFLDIIADNHIHRARSFMKNAKKKPSNWEEFLLLGKYAVLNAHLKIFQKKSLIFIYGNDKYVDYERIRERLENEITNAIKIHKRSLPKNLPNADNISFASLYIPAQELGGDLFDAFKVDNGLLNEYFDQYVCYIADVSGHGLDSAMLAIFVKDTIRSYFRLKHIPGQLVSPKEIMNFFVEQYMKEGYPGEYLVCLFLIVFDLKTNELTYCSAGFHKSPLMVKKGGNIVELNNGGLPISAAIEADLLNYEDHSMPLPSEMTLFIMTDGLPEQRSNNKFYEDRFKKLIYEIYFLDPSHQVQKIYEDFNEFLKFEKIKDDITLVVVKLVQSSD